jgi:hypothetical protein
MATSNHSSVPEGFKEVPGYDGRYFINQKGEVWGAWRGKVLRVYTDVAHFYPYIKARKDGKSLTTPVHRLMRLVWMPPPPGPIGTSKGMWCVNHKDGNKTNNCIDNLEWMTCEENVKHAWRTGLSRVTVGEDCTIARLTSKEVTIVRQRLIAGESNISIARSMGICRHLIGKIKCFTCWKHQDHDLIKPMMDVCSSKWLQILLNTLNNKERIKTCYIPKKKQSNKED